MHYFALLLITFVVAGCKTTDLKPPKERPDWNPVGENVVRNTPAPTNDSRNSTNSFDSSHLDRIKARYTAREMTPEEKVEAKALSKKYYQGLVQTIIEIDDGETSPEIIGKSAVIENQSALKTWKRVELRRFTEVDDPEIRRKAENLDGLPSQSHFDDATYIVLKLRAKARNSSDGVSQPRTVESSI
jgi:hypothetical protein